MDLNKAFQEAKMFVSTRSKLLFEISSVQLKLNLKKQDFNEILQYEFIPIYLELIKIHQKKQNTVFLGIAGVNGSGKTTLARFLVLLLQSEGFSAISFSMDDLYPTKEKRLKIAREIDPSLGTRLMYDNQLIKSVFISLIQWTGPIKIPQFDKSVDDRVNEDEWLKLNNKPDFVIIEGVFTFAQPVSDESLSKVDKYINSQVRDLSEDYNFIDLKIALLTESIDSVIHFRQQQEIELQKKVGKEYGMTQHEVEVFIRYFQKYLERYTWAQINNPLIDLVFVFNSNRKIIKITSPKNQIIFDVFS